MEGGQNGPLFSTTVEGHCDVAEILIFVSFISIQGVKKLRLQRFRNDRGGKNKHVFYLTKLWLMHRFAARWS